MGTPGPFQGHFHSFCCDLAVVEWLSDSVTLEPIMVVVDLRFNQHRIGHRRESKLTTAISLSMFHQPRHSYTVQYFFAMLPIVNLARKCDKKLKYNLIINSTYTKYNVRKINMLYTKCNATF